MQFNFKIKLLLGGLIFFFFQLNLLRGQCEDRSNYWEESWKSCETSSNPNSARSEGHWLLFEFNEPQAIGTSHIWNANRSGESALGAEEVYIDVSVDGINWLPLATDPFTWPRATEADNYEGFEGPSFESFGFIKKVLFTVVKNYGDANCVSIAEVKFDINPLACYGIEDICGVCDGPGLITYYEDADGDGLGNPWVAVENCEQPDGYVPNADDPCDTGLYGWSDMQILFEENGCTGCHSNSGASGLDLTSFQGISAGGDVCGNEILSGTNLVGIITIPGYDGCSRPIGFPSMNERVGGAIDENEIAMIQEWINAGAPFDCNCPEGSPDADNDGVCDASDFCPNFNDNLIGTPCDDGMACTTNDTYRTSCNCEGTPIPDSDFDGVCDSEDQAPNNPCTADGIIGLPEPQDWVAHSTNDCDEDGIYLKDGDQDDFDACIDDEGITLSPECSCPEGAIQSGGQLKKSQGVWSTTAFNAEGISDGVLTNGIGWNAFIELTYPYLEIGQQICFDVGFNNAEGGVKFEINELGSYKFYNQDTSKVNYELQNFCFPVFMAGEQRIRVTRLVTGAVRVDGSNYEHCPCNIADPQFEFTSCYCPNDFTTGEGSFVSGGEFSNPENTDGAPDGNFSGWINGEDSLILSFPELEPFTEICVNIAFNNAAGKVGFDLNGKYFEVVNPSGSTDNSEGQDICFLTTATGPQELIITEEGWGSIWVDGAIYKTCNGCRYDEDNDGVCDEDDICPEGDDTVDIDNDGIPDACDPCSTVGQTCDDNDACTVGDVFDEDCNCVGTFADADNDGVCDADDICAAGDDAFDIDNDGIPDACDECSTAGQQCNDNDPCTVGDAYDEDCNCIGTFADADSDGVCDVEDVCPDGDDTIDTDNDGIPDDCDDCSIVGQSCDDGAACTTGDVYDADCNCVGIFADADNDGVCDAEDICAAGDDTVDTDNDGIPDACDDCSTVGQVCDDGDPCTIGDVYDENCNCVGEFEDTDMDGVCNEEDICPVGDDNMDQNNNGTPDACDTCVTQFTWFGSNVLNYSGIGSGFYTIDLNGHLNPSFTITKMDSNISGSADDKYIDQVEIRYVDMDGNFHSFGEYSGALHDTVQVDLVGAIQSITVILSDGFDYNASQLQISLSNISYCENSNSSLLPTPGEEDIDSNSLDGVYSLNVYPNPTIGQPFYVVFDAPGEGEEYTLFLSDEYGRNHHEQKVKGSPNGIMVKFEVDQMSSGVYFVTLKHDSLIRTKRIVVLRD